MAIESITSAAVIAPTSVAASGNTIHRIVAVLLTVTAGQRTGSEAPPEVIPYRTVSELHNETSAGKAAISGVTIALVIVEA